MKNWQLFVYRKKDIASLKGITAAGRGKWIWSAVTDVVGILGDQVELIQDAF